MTFGLHFVSSDSIEDIFAEVIMSEAPSDSRCTYYADYLTVNYITQESKFPPNLWAEPPSNVRRTTNGAGLFHSHFNAQFYFVILPYMPTWSVIIVDVPNCEHVHSFTCLFLNDYYLLKCNKLKVFNRSCSKFTSPW